MEILINISEYNPETGFKFLWEDGFKISTDVEANKIVLFANKAGLISMAKHLLSLAQDEYYSGYHFHLDEYNSLEEGSVELVIGKL
jgi:hypothetical protein